MSSASLIVRLGARARVELPDEFLAAVLKIGEHLGAHVFRHGHLGVQRHKRALRAAAARRNEREALGGGTGDALVRHLHVNDNEAVNAARAEQRAGVGGARRCTAARREQQAIARSCGKSV